MKLQKTTNAALLSSLLLTGCAAALPDSSAKVEDGTESAHELLERADRNDLQLDSYHMHSHDAYQTGQNEEKTEFDVRVQFRDGTLYMISSFPEGSSRLAKYELKKNRNHSIDGSSFAVTSGIWAFLDPDGLLNDCFSVDDEMEVEDYISIPEVYLYSQNTFEIAQQTDAETVIELVSLANAPAEQPEGVSFLVQFALSPEGYLKRISSKETGPDQSYQFERTRTFSDFNSDLINTQALERFLNQAASREISAGQKVNLADYLAAEN